MEYENIAVKLASSLKARFLTKDPDFVGDAIRELILADQKFNGNGTLQGYRKQRIKWLLGSYYKNRYKANHPLVLNFTDIQKKGHYEGNSRN